MNFKNKEKIYTILTDKNLCIMLLISGMMILALRNYNPLANPIMYTEDGQWIGLALTKGWIETFINAREEYFVWGNILFLYFSYITSFIVCGDSLVCLPQAIAIFSYFYFASIATFSWWVTKGVLSNYSRLLLWALILLIPLGDSSNEIIGRLSNIGYFLVYLTFLLMYLKISRRKRLILADTLLLLCAATNPVCIPLIPLLSIFYFGEGGRLHNSCEFWSSLKKNINNNIYLLTGLVIITFFTAVRIMSSKESSIIGEFQINNLIEVGIARSILYPFLFPFYNMLSDSSSILLGIFLVILLLYLYKKQKHQSAKLLTSMAAVSFLVFWLFTLFMRQSLTQQLTNYNTTFPDRYFMGLNVIMIFILIALSSDNRTSNSNIKLLGNKKIFTKEIIIQITKKLILSLLILIYLLSLGWIIEGNKPRMKIVTGPNFRQQICLFANMAKNNDEIISMPIHFNGFRMAIPSKTLEESSKHLSCNKLVENFYISDANWSLGVAKKWAGFFVPNDKIFSRSYKPGRFVRFSNKDIRKITHVTPSGDYLNIFVEGEILNPKEVGIPIYYCTSDRPSN